MGTIRKLCVQCAVLFGILGFFAGPADAASYKTQAQLDQAAAFATDPMFQSVGWISAFDSSGKYFTASGTLINPEWVLTVGHAVTSTTGSYTYGFCLTSSVYGTSLDQVVMADAVYTYPGYTADSWGGNNNDIALIHLSSAIMGVTTAALYTGSDEAGMHVYMSGYGLPGTITSGIGDFDGVERAGENVIEKVGWSSLGIGNQYLITDFGQLISTESLPMEWQATQGDSGGGWFSIIDGTTYLVGLSDFVLGEDITGGVSVSYYNDWITETTASTSVPEPSSLVLLVTLTAAGLPIVRRSRKRRLSA